ncbi:MAG: hypothetical protein NZ602_06020 [Thermoguttaceae bacterium]|nr:hypothetical protein [Thermoguttaceae bacterium]MDW8038602.1 hypothetical protein [Thermoguttaceae bacterium]
MIREGRTGLWKGVWLSGVSLLVGCMLPFEGTTLLAPAGPPSIVVYQNPLLLPSTDYQRIWEIVVDVIDDEFRIEREMPVRQMGGVWTEGRLETYPLVGSTLLEPWRQDASNWDEKLEGTLQSIRRRAIVRVIPAQAGVWVEVVVFKELEDTKPLMAPTARAIFQYDTSLTRIEAPIAEQPTSRGWIPLGRDPALEQQVLGKIQQRVSGLPPQPIPFWPWRSTSGG